MNDNELDDLLTRWETPEAPASKMRARLKMDSPRRPRFTWSFREIRWGLVTAGLAGAATCFVGIAAAFPQAILPEPRFNLISEVVRYKADGSQRVQEYRASTARDGVELMLDQSYPDNPFMTIHQRFFNTIHQLLGIGSAPTAMSKDCQVPSLTVIGRESILNYTTTVQRTLNEDGSRYTEYRAPELDCAVMKYVVETPVGNGQFRIASEKRPMTVRINHAQ